MVRVGAGERIPLLPERAVLQNPMSWPLYTEYPDFHSPGSRVAMAGVPASKGRRERSERLSAPEKKFAPAKKSKSFRKAVIYYG